MANYKVILNPFSGNLDVVPVVTAPPGPSESANSVISMPCAANCSPGDWVISSNGTAIQALADSMDNSNVIGVVESKSSITDAVVRVAGISGSIFISLDTTKEYYLSDTTPGAMVAQDAGIPNTPGSVLLKLGQPLDSTRFLVSKGSRIVRS